MRQAIKDFIAQELLSGQQFADDEELLLSGMVDSLGVMKLVAFIDREIGIKVPHADIKLRNFSTIDAIVTYLDSKQTV